MCPTFYLQTISRLWGGRFSGEPNAVAEHFCSSLRHDRRLWAADLQGSQAYARALARCGLLTAQQLDMIERGLEKVQTAELPHDEDIHSINERRLKEVIGEVAGMLHTGRSRNDQVGMQSLSLTCHTPHHFGIKMCRTLNNLV
uniref:Fumarate lyase N-terminal domain-containing protein n=1 Tax=Eptatretus burgeri TaxID=7764 RepID=A0A8C4NE13_EPTBU